MKTDFSLWTRYFRSNVHHVAAIRFAPLPELSLSEKRRIQHSLARFQSGQNSDGKQHRKKIVALGNPELLQACRYFIREEVDHSMLLAQFMNQENIPLKTNDWVNRLFRLSRSNRGILWTTHTLVSAEILGATYYAALRNLTRSATLESICKVILRDQAQHIRFQNTILCTLYANKPAWKKPYIKFMRALSFYGAALFFYLMFYKVLEKGGYRFHNYFRLVRRSFSWSQRAMQQGVIPPGVREKWIH